MTTSIDTNVIAALWSDRDPFNAAALKILGQPQLQSDLIIAGAVYVELLAGPLRSEAALDRFLSETGVSVDWVLDEAVWREAGRAYRGYTQRRYLSNRTYPRRMLTDFLIGAHAFVRGYALLTLDKRLYTAAFPKLSIVTA